MIGQDERGISRGEYEGLVNKVELLTKLFRGIQLNNEETEDGAFKHKLLKILDHLDGSVTRDKLNFSPIQMYYQADAPTSGMSTGDYWVDSDTNKVYYYNGSAWSEVQDDDIAQAIADAATAQATADGKIYVYKQTTAPASGMGTGDLWFDTDDGNKVYRYSGSAWEEVKDTGIAQAISDAATAQATADGKITTFIQASAPTAEGTGDLWMDSDDGYKAYCWSGSAWVDIQDTDIAQALTDAATAQGEADRKIVTFVQSSAPTAEQTGDLWMDNDDDNKLYRWSGSEWIAAEFDVASWSKIIDDDSNKPADNATVGADWDSNLSNIPSALYQMFYNATAPASGMSTGDYWVDSDDKKLYRYSGAAWVEIQDDEIATAIANAATAQSTADTKILTYVQTSAPSASETGDIWIDTDDNNHVYRWSGSAWASYIQDEATWSKVAGAGKPDDNATLGATFGTDINKGEFLGEFIDVRWEDWGAGYSDSTNFVCNGDSYIYGIGKKVTGGVSYGWVWTFSDNQWRLLYEEQLSADANDEFYGCCVAGSYIYVNWTDDSGGVNNFTRYDLTFNNATNFTWVDVPANHRYYYRLTTDGTDFYMMGSNTNTDLRIGKFTISGTNVTYSTSWRVDTNDWQQAAFVSIMCDGTYIYITHQAASHIRGNIIRMTKTGGSQTTYTDMLLEYPIGTSIATDRTICNGLIYYGGLYYTIENIYKMILDNSGAGDNYGFYPRYFLKEVTF